MNGPEPHHKEIVVHIGPHKTGTTSIQESLHRARHALRDLGVAYLYDEGRVNLNTSVSELMRQVRAGDGRSRNTRAPRRITAVLRATDCDQIVMSAEHLSSFRDDEVRALFELLAREKPGHRVRVVVTLRRIDKMIPSLWQQSVRGRVMPSLAEWTRGILTDPKHKDAFRVDHIGLLSRWVAHAGPSALTVVVADDARPRALYDAFEQLLGLPSGILVEGRIANRSLNLQQAELVRAAHQQMLAAGMMQSASGSTSADDNQGVDIDSLRWPYMRIAREMCRTRSSIPGDPIVLPSLFYEQAVRRADETIRHVRACGIATIGDLDALRPTPDPRAPQGEAAAVSVTPEQSAELLVSALHAVGLSGSQVDSRYLSKISSSKLLRLLVKRALPWSLRARFTDRGRSR